MTPAETRDLVARLMIGRYGDGIVGTQIRDKMSRVMWEGTRHMVELRNWTMSYLKDTCEKGGVSNG